MDPRSRAQRVAWALPWLVFLAFPVADLITTARPVPVEVGAGLGLLAFGAAYLVVFAHLFAPVTRDTARELLVLAVLGVGLAVWLGPAWSGLLIYVSAAASGALPHRWVWPAVLAATAVCAGVVAAHGLLVDLFILPLICLVTAFALLGTRFLVGINAELVAARDELARSAVAEERMRFARDLHDLLGHSLSLIALKSELAGRLAERDPARARAEMADVESAARQALAEVREAVSGYRQVGVDSALAEARSALSAAGIGLRAGAPVALPPAVDAVLGWVLREATTNVLRHSAASCVTVEVRSAADESVLTVTDDGRGGTATPGAGLTGAAERLAGVAGRLTTGPAEDGGFRLVATVPVRATAGVVAP